MDENQRKKLFINYHRKIFEYFLNPLSILPKMSCLKNEVYEAIAFNHGSPKKQVDIFLKALDNCEDPHALQMLLDAINNTEDQKWLYPVLNESLSCSDLEQFFKYSDSIEEIKKLWQLLQPQLSNVDVEDCIHVLPVQFSQEEKESLLQKCRNYGNCYTLWWLIEVLTRKEKGWIQNLVDHLEDRNYLTTDGQKTVAELIKQFFDFSDDVSDDNESAQQAGTVQAQPEKFSSLAVCASSDVYEQHDDENVSKNHENGDFMKSSATKNKPGIQLRGYQKELVDSAEKGKNVIICAPPGAGKTVIAAHITQNYLEKQGNLNKSVLFFTPGSSLALQQTQRLKEFLHSEFSVDSCYGNTEDSDLVLHDADVIVLTPQILLNALKNNAKSNPIKSIGQYGLLIFDECHHCMKGHPYNGVMREYFKLKRKFSDSSQNIPQVIGLTATMGFGKKSNNADEEVMQLCSNLDAVDGIITVQDPQHLIELEGYIPLPDEEIHVLERRKNDEFFIQLVFAIDKLLQRLKTFGDFNPPHYSSSNDDVELMKHWSVSTKREVAGWARDGRDPISCLEYIGVIVDAIELHLKCRAVDAISVLEDFKSKKIPEKFSGNEILLYSEFTELLEKLYKLRKDESCSNPDLALIENLLLKKFVEKSDSMGMLMVQKRIYTKVLKDWMNQNKKLSFLRAEVFTGAGTNTDWAGTGLSRNKQQSVMKSFREGKHKMLICTPDAAGEGIDVAGCNLVVNYDYMKNDTAMVQIRGRVRKHGGRVIQLSSPKVANRDRLNAKKTDLMKKAVISAQDMMKKSMDGFKLQLSTMQEIAMRMYESELKAKLTKRQESDKEFLLQCRKCFMDVCSSLDIRLIDGGQHTNATSSFKEKCKTIDHPRKNHPMGIDWDKKSKILCRECANDWGIEAIWKNSITLPLIKMEGLRVVDKINGNGRIYTPKKWKNAPFKPIVTCLADITD